MISSLTFYSINTLPNDNILPLSKLKEFADDKINVTGKMKICLRKVRKHYGKGEDAGYQDLLFLFSHIVFKRLLFQGRVSPVLFSRGLNLFLGNCRLLELLWTSKIQIRRHRKRSHILHLHCLPLIAKLCLTLSSSAVIYIEISLICKSLVWSKNGNSFRRWITHVDIFNKSKPPRISNWGRGWEFLAEHGTLHIQDQTARSMQSDLVSTLSATAA